MSETRLWTWLKPYLPRGQYTRVETGETGPGTPDVHYRLNTNDGWIELKDSRHPNADVPFKNEDDGLHKSQKVWIRGYVVFDGIVWIAARVGKEIFWVPGKNAEVFNGASLRRLRAISAHVTDSSKPDVRKIKQLLQGEDQ